jgi:hypothetical protein
LRFEGILKIQFARKSTSKGQKPANSITSAHPTSQPAQGIQSSSRTTVYSIGKNRFRELLAHPMPDSLLSRILARASEKDFASLSDDEILTYLSASSEQIRKLVAMKSILSLTRQRLKQIFDSYMNLDRRYYNVIHWLDMGTSVSKSRAIAAAKRVLSKPD